MCCPRSVFAAVERCAMAERYNHLSFSKKDVYFIQCRSAISVPATATIYYWSAAT